MATTMYRPDPGRVGGAMAEALAWLHSSATIAGEIARLEAAQRAGDRSEATGVLLADWRAVQRAQVKLVGGDKQEPPRWRRALPWLGCGRDAHDVQHAPPAAVSGWGAAPCGRPPG